MKGFRKVGTAFAVAGSSTLALMSGSVSAAGWDYSTLTDGVDFSTIAVGVLAVAAMLAAVYAGIKGAKVVLSFLRS